MHAMIPGPIDTIHCKFNPAHLRNIPVPWILIPRYYLRIMARKIPSYKNVVLTPPGQAPALPPTLTESERLAMEERKKQEAQESRIVPTKIPQKILTPMEMRSRAIALMNERGYDPIRELIKIANNSTTDERTRIDIHKHLAKYVYPEQKAVDLNVSGDLNLTVNVVKFAGAQNSLAPNREAIPVRAVEVAS